MKRKSYLRLTVSLVLVITILCSFSIVAFAAKEYSGVHTWTNGSLSYSATVVRGEAYNEREIPIMSSAVQLPKNVSYTFGNCNYQVSYSCTLWTSYTTQLNTAGAKVDVASTFNKNIKFNNTITFASPDVPGTFYAFTDCYGYIGNYYVQKHGASPQTVYSGSYSFAPFNCSNMILYVLDARYI